ncbi:MAG: ATP-binding cassette domain-containing protein [Oscillospiraceae bacterium]|nr:ATP-binding cassette domain-containing protein [Oscillospiraceae bacterium]
MKLSPFTKTYEGRQVLDFPGMELKKGTIYAVIGANGSGKSTFAKIVSGILKADRGGCPVSGGTVGYLPQKHYAFRMTTKANLLLNGKSEARACELMDALQLRHLEAKRADRLSGGETARMALARLMMNRYDLVLLDEPTAAMDMETTLLSEQRIARYVQETGCTLILVTHSLQQARRLAGEVWYFHRGKLLESGAADQVLSHPEQPQTRQFLDFYGI